MTEKLEPTGPLPSGTPPDPGSGNATKPAPVNGLTLRALIIAVVLTFAAAFWVRQSELLVDVSQITESVPAIPALAILVVLVFLKAALTPLTRRFNLTRAETLTIYCFVVVAISMSGPGVVRFLLACITVPFYYGNAGNRIDTLYHYIPSWLAVKDPDLIKQLYEGNHTHTVPWGPWILPIISWTALLMLLFFCMLCLIRIVQEQWMHSERLTFPIVKLPLEITDTDEHSGEKPFLRNPVMWVGFGAAVIYNALNILHAFFPSIPCPGNTMDLTPFLSAPPWNSMGGITLFYRPELIGFGFLVPSDICFSIWFFFIMLRLEALVAHLFAWDFPGMPFDQEQSIGAYILLGAWLLWQVRDDVMRPIKAAWKNRTLRDTGVEPPLWAVAGFAISFLLAFLICVKAGMEPWVVFAYLALILLVAVVIARVRAAAGIPLIWLFPFYLQKKVLLYVLGTAVFIKGGAPASLTVFAMMTVLCRGYFPAMIGYQVESLKIAEDAHIKRGSMIWTLMLAALVGLVIAFYIHLTTYYQHGATSLGGIWMWPIALDEFTKVASVTNAPQNPDLFRTLATTAGGVTAFLLLVLRRAFVAFPLHPIGYAVATAFGGLVWWSFFVVWVIKGLVLRFGGIRLYRKTIPMFLGFAIGHFFAGGVVWGLLGAFWKDAARAYGVYFG